MRGKFMIYALLVALTSAGYSWTSMAARAGGGMGSGNSWHTYSSGPGYFGGGFSSSSGGGHK